MNAEQGHSLTPGKYAGASDAPDGAAPGSRGRSGGAPNSDFEAALKARYERLSLLTLDLAEEAALSAKQESTGKRMAQVTRAIWAHQTIERLRCGRASSAVRRLSRPSCRQSGKENCTAPDVSREIQSDLNRMRTIGERKTPANQKPPTPETAAPLTTDACNSQASRPSATCGAQVTQPAVETVFAHKCKRRLAGRASARYCRAAPYWRAADAAVPRSFPSLRRIALSPRAGAAYFTVTPKPAELRWRMMQRGHP